MRHLFRSDRNLVLQSREAFTYRELLQGRVSVRVKTRYSARGFQELIQMDAVVNDLYVSPLKMMNVTYVPDLDRINVSFKEHSELKIFESVVSIRIENEFLSILMS